MKREVCSCGGGQKTKVMAVSLGCGKRKSMKAEDRTGRSKEGREVMLLCCCWQPSWDTIVRIHLKLEPTSRIWSEGNRTTEITS